MSMSQLNTSNLDVEEKDILGIWKQGTDYMIISQKNTEDVNLLYTKVSKLPTHLDPYLFDLPQHLCGEVHVIISSLSGTGLAPLYYAQVIAPLLEVIGVKSEATFTTSCNSIREIAPILKDTVILLSGDGGLHDLINSAVRRLTVVMFPLGSGNALFNSYIDNGIRSLLRGSSRPLPNYQAKFSQAIFNGKSLESVYGAMIVSYGFHATLVEESEKLRQLGDQRFQKVAKELLESPRTYVGTVNGEEMKGYAAATMVKKLDKNFSISPENGLRLIHTDTSNLMRGYFEGLGAQKVDTIEFIVDGKICVDGYIVEAQNRVTVEEVTSILDLVV